MSETEAMDISSPDSPVEYPSMPGVDPGLNVREPNQISEHANDALSMAAPSDAQMGGADTVLKPTIRLRDDVPGEADPNERPLKRARTLDIQPTLNEQTIQIERTSDEGSNMPRSGRLTPEQQDHCEHALNSICKLSFAGPFLAPVDPVLAKAPDYYQVITRPMDLRTINNKLKSRTGTDRSVSIYADLQEFVDDVNLVFDNCFKYNGSTHAISQLAIRVKDAFEDAMKTAPGGQNLKFIPVTITASSQDPTFSPGIKQMSQSMSDLALKPASPSGPPVPKRRNTAVAKPLPPTNLNARSRRDPLRIAQEKFCKATLDHLYRAEYEAWALPFLGPVDLNAYPDYLEIVKHPMDFGKISDNLSHGIYATAEDFQSDVKLVFSNCYAFNPTWAPVYDSAKKLEAVFDEKWKGLPLSVPESVPPPKVKRSSGASSVPTRSKGQSTAPRNHSKKRPVPTSITEDQLFSLCEVLSNLSDRKMDQVIALIRRRMPQYRDNTEELDLTIENIPTAVQAEMFAFLKQPKEKKDNVKHEHGSSDSSSLTSAASDFANSSDESG